jgi:FdhE protein
MPPLAKATFEPLEEVSQTVLEFFKQIRGLAVPAEAEAASASFSEAPSGMRIEAIRDALQDTPPENIPQRVLILAALQVHFSMMAAQLNAADLNPAGDGICPVCGSPPLASAVVGWPGAHGARFCTCALCGTMWNAVRVKCVFCGSTEGISYLSIEERPETLKAETCEKCGSYLKIFYQVKDHLLEPCADDIASLDLDMMLTEAGWRRGGNNPFLLGY